MSEAGEEGVDPGFGGEVGIRATLSVGTRFCEKARLIVRVLI